MRVISSSGGPACRLCVLALLIVGAWSNPPSSYTGTIDVITGHEDGDVAILRDDSGGVSHLRWAEHKAPYVPSALYTGVRVTVLGTKAPTERGVLDVDSFEVVAPPNTTETTNSTSQIKTRVTTNLGSGTLNSITWVLKICGVSPKISSSTVRSWYFNERSPSSSAITLQRFFSTCSANKLSFNSGSSIVVDVTLPCSSKLRSGLSTNFAKCDSTEIYGWAEAAEAYTRNTLRIDVGKYQRRILVLPDAVRCPWAGLGSIGCGSSCYAWIKGVKGVSLPVIEHEVGHTLGLDHAALTSNSYGDGSCPMGYASSITKCYNAPHLYQLGWANPIATLRTTTGNFAAGRWFNYNLPATSASTNNHIQVVATGTLVHFVSFRTTTGYDRWLEPKWSNRVYIHAWPGRRGAAGGGLTTIVGQGTSGVLSGPSFRVRINRISGSTAAISICRISGSSLCR